MISKALVMFSITMFALASPGRADDSKPALTVLCNQLERHMPSDDANYKPGVDVHGKAVVPADLNAPLPVDMGKVFIPVEIDLINKFGLALDPALELKGEAALISVDPSGNVTYNGRDITASAAAACGLKDDMGPPAPAQAPVQAGVKP